MQGGGGGEVENTEERKKKKKKRKQLFTRTRPDFFRRDMCYLINTLFRRPQRLETKPLTLDLEPQMPPSINSPVPVFKILQLFYFFFSSCNFNFSSFLSEKFETSDFGTASF